MPNERHDQPMQSIWGDTDFKALAREVEESRRNPMPDMIFASLTIGAIVW